MVSQSRSGINIALCLTTMLMTASTTQAQVSNVPKRYRSKADYNKSKELGRKQRQLRGQQQQRTKTNLRKLEGDLSMPLQESEFDMSVPSGLIVNMMSMPLQESDFDLSMPLQESGFDVSIPGMSGETIALIEDAIAASEDESTAIPPDRPVGCMSIDDGVCPEGTSCQCWLNCKFCVAFFAPCGTCETDDSASRDSFRWSNLISKIEGTSSP